MKKLLAALLVFCCTALPAFAQSTITLPIAANAAVDIGNGPVKVRVVSGNASIFTSQGSGIGSTSGSATALTLTATPATAPLVGGLISGAGITSGTTVAAYNGTTGITLSAAMTVPSSTTVSWGAACPSSAAGIPANYIQGSVSAGYYMMYTQARVCAVAPGNTGATLLIEPIYYDQVVANAAVPGGTVGQIQTNNGSNGFGAIAVVPLSQGGLGGSQSGATVNQIPVYPGSAGAAAPTTIGGSGGLFDAICSSTIGQFWVRLSGGWGCTSLGYADPVWWDADPTGRNDSSAAFQNAANASAAVFVPVGTFLVQGGTVTFSGSNIRVFGAGPGSIIETGTNTSADLFDFSGLSDVEVDHLQIIGGLSNTAGTLINFTSTNTNAGNFSVHNIWINQAYNGIAFQGGQNTFINNVFFNNVTNISILYGPSFQGSGYISNVQMSLLTSGTGKNTGYGILAYNGDGFLWNNINIYGAATGIGVIPEANGYVRNLKTANVFADTSNTGNDWSFVGTASGSSITRIDLTNSWGGNSAQSGFLIDDVTEISIIGSRAIVNTDHGFDFEGTNVGVRLVGNIAEGNSHVSSGTFSGFNFAAAAVTHLQMEGNRSGPSSTDFVTNTQNYGIAFGSSACTDCVIADNDVTGNVTGGINTALASSSGNVVKDNPGYNPVGCSSVSTSGWSTGQVVTAGPSPESWFFSGAVTSLVSTATLLSAPASATVPLAPGQSLQINYASVPTVARCVQ